MTLIVNTFIRTANGGMDFVDVDHSDELAGFESCRTDLWGHVSVRALGLKLLPTLAEQDIYAEGDDIRQLESDVHLLLSHVMTVAEKTKYSTDFINHRCQNMLNAIRRAREVGGGVVIW
jgi:hypothetical protein